MARAQDPYRGERPLMVANLKLIYPWCSVPDGGSLFLFSFVDLRDKLLEGWGAAPHPYIRGERSPLMVAREFGKHQIDLPLVHQR